MNSPKEVVPNFDWSRYLERGNASGLGIHELQEVPNRAVFSACISTLKDDEEGCLSGSEHQFLEIGDPLGELLKFFQCSFFRNVATIGSVKILKIDRVTWLHSEHSPSLTLTQRLADLQSTLGSV